MDARTRTRSAGRVMVSATIVVALLAGAVPSLVVATNAASAESSETEAAPDDASRFSITGTMGDGSPVDIVVGVIDSGIWPEHPGVAALDVPIGDGLDAGVLDRCSSNGHFWFFASGAGLDSELTLTDTTTGQAKTYAPTGDMSPPGASPLAILDPLALDCSDPPESGPATRVPNKLTGRAKQRLVAGGQTCGDRWENKFTLRTRKGKTTLQRDFGRGVKNSLLLEGADADSQSAVFRDDDKTFDALMVLWLDGETLSGILAEGPEGIFTDEVAESLLGPMPTGAARKSALRSLAGPKNSCGWNSDVKLGKKSRRDLAAFWEGFMPALDETALLLNDGRFKVDIDWSTGVQTSTLSTPVVADGRFYFFSPEDWELLVNVLDGCRFNDHLWVFAAATTNVEYDLSVTDTKTGTTTTYSNPLGQAAPAIVDTQAFATCP